MSELPPLERELSAPPFVLDSAGTPWTLPEVKAYGIVPGQHGEQINFAVIEPDYMPADRYIMRVGEWVYISGDITAKTKGSQAPQSEEIRRFVAQEIGDTSKPSGKASLRSQPTGQLVLKLLPESYIPKIRPQDQA
jgi:hypothetical protein